MEQKHTIELTDILLKLESALLVSNTPIKIPLEGVRAAVFIFTNIMADKMWELQESEHMNMDDRINMSEKFGIGIRELIKIYTDIDTFTFYENAENEG